MLSLCHSMTMVMMMIVIIINVIIIFVYFVHMFQFISSYTHKVYIKLTLHIWYLLTVTTTTTTKKTVLVLNASKGKRERNTENTQCNEGSANQIKIRLPWNKSQQTVVAVHCAYIYTIFCHMRVRVCVTHRPHRVEKWSRPCVCVCVFSPFFLPACLFIWLCSLRLACTVHSCSIVFHLYFSSYFQW